MTNETTDGTRHDTHQAERADDLADDTGTPDDPGTAGDTRATTGVGGLEVEIDRTTCMGSGNCQFWAPHVFDLDDDGIAVVVDPAGDPEEKIVLAARGCPTQAITVRRDGDAVAP